MVTLNSTKSNCKKLERIALKLIAASLALDINSSAIPFSFLLLDLAEFKVTVIAKLSI